TWTEKAPTIKGLIKAVLQQTRRRPTLGLFQEPAPPAECRMRCLPASRGSPTAGLGSQALVSTLTQQQQPTDNEHRTCRAAVHAERNGPATALVQHDHGINDRNESGGGHEPAKDVRGPVSHKDCDEQSRCNVTNAFSG